MTIQAGMTGTRDFGSLAAEIEELLATTAIPEGFHLRMGGEREEQREANRNVHLIVVLSILLVYMIMAALFESLLHPFVILLAIPFAAVGGIMLVGVAVNNGIIMVDYTNQLRQRGFDVMEATWRGAVTRLRPVLITTLTTALALLPLAIGFGEGGEIWAPLGRVVVGGLSVAALFTLFLVPTLYSLVEERRALRIESPASARALSPGGVA